ncbi:MAG: hypothetical protein JWN63_2759 [Candidatus Acidoferrum typicum]|nr:hypothetical protein [Candidatus Acidoferrum typicum]
MSSGGGVSANGHLLNHKQNQLPVLFSLNHEGFLGCRFEFHVPSGCTPPYL